MPIQFWRPRGRDDGKNSQPNISQPSAMDGQLAPLKARFVVRLRGEYQLLAQYRENQLPRTPELVGLIHRMAGSAGMIGFAEISSVAGRLDDELAEPQSDTSEAFQSLLALLEKTISGHEFPG